MKLNVHGNKLPSSHGNKLDGQTRCPSADRHRCLYTQCNFADFAKLSRDIYSSERRVSRNRIERRVYSIQDQKCFHRESLEKWKIFHVIKNHFL